MTTTYILEKKLTIQKSQHIKTNVSTIRFIYQLHIL